MMVVDGKGVPIGLYLDSVQRLSRHPASARPRAYGDIELERIHCYGVLQESWFGYRMALEEAGIGMALT